MPDRREAETIQLASSGPDPIFGGLSAAIWQRAWAALAAFTLLGMVPVWSAAGDLRPSAPPVVYRASLPLAQPAAEPFAPTPAFSVQLAPQPFVPTAAFSAHLAPQLEAGDADPETALDVAPGAEPEPIDAGKPVAMELVPLRDLNSVKIASSGPEPTDYARARFGEEETVYDMPGACRGWAGFVRSWTAPALCYGPLYFEDACLERYGHQFCPLVQPAVSAAHFFATVPALPYLATVHCPCECIYTLGHYRPGSYVPFHCEGVPLDLKAGAVEGGVITGLIFLVP